MRGTLGFGVLVVSALLASPTTANADDMARIVTQDTRPEECISRVAIQKIDGEEKFVPAEGFKLKPGRHTLSGTVALDTRYCLDTERLRGVRIEAIAPLEADFEAGKTYFVGFDHQSTDPAQWGYVIWQIE